MTPQRLMFGGIVLAAIGGIITWATYAMAEEGDTYPVAWGLMAVGGWFFLRGLFRLMRGKGSGTPVPEGYSPPAPTVTSPAPAPPVATGYSPAATPGQVAAPVAPRPALRRCPFCAEEIQPQAVICRWCGRQVAGEVPPPPPPSL